MLDLTALYTENLAVPKRKKTKDPAVLQGKQAFYEAGCASCHTPKFVTKRGNVAGTNSFQLIWPYSDFLLHDMGDAWQIERKTAPSAQANGARRHFGALATQKQLPIRNDICMMAAPTA